MELKDMIEICISENAFNIITCIYYVIFLFSVILIYNQLKELKKQREESHESKRRELAINILNKWHSNNKLAEMFIAKKFVKELQRDVKKKIMNHEPIQVDGYLIDFIKLTICTKIKNCIGDCDKCEINKKIICTSKDNYSIEKINLSEKSVVLLRSLIVSYFNHLEIIASAYKHNVADREIIKEQLFYIAEDDENFLSLLNEFGVKKNFPCLTFFVEHIKSKQLEGKERLGK